jgi:cell division protein FtsW
MASQRNHIDIATLITVLTLMVISVGVVYSASAELAFRKYANMDHYLDLHAVKILLSIAALFVGITVPYTLYKRFTKTTLLLAILILGVTFVLGGETKGAVRWLRFGGIGFQPSEFAKFALLFHLSYLLATKGEAIREFKQGYIPAMIWVGLVAVLVMLQPNFSTGSMIVLLSMTVLFVGGVRLKHLFWTGMAVLPVLAGYLLMAPYRLERMRTFIEGHSTGKMSHQLLQGLIGFANGGIFGVGPGESRQRDFFLPEPHNDFVFSIVGEEYGLIGTLVITAAFLFFMLRGFRIAKFAKDSFGRYLAISITSTITLYALVNSGVALGLLPTTGLPMPFISYGGSALMFSGFAVGVLLNISAYTDLHPRASRVVDEASEAGPQPETGLGKVY